MDKNSSRSHEDGNKQLWLRIKVLLNAVKTFRFITCIAVALQLLVVFEQPSISAGHDQLTAKFTHRIQGVWSCLPSLPASRHRHNRAMHSSKIERTISANDNRTHGAIADQNVHL